MQQQYRTSADRLRQVKRMDQSAFILRTTALLLLLVCVTGEAVLEIMPHPEQVLLGEGFLLVCTSTHEQGILTWLKDGVPVQHSPMWATYDRETYQEMAEEEEEEEGLSGESWERWEAMHEGRMVITPDESSSVLVVPTAELTDGGTYTCKLGEDTTTRLAPVMSSTEVHVLEPPTPGPEEFPCTPTASPGDGSGSSTAWQA